MIKAEKWEHVIRGTNGMAGPQLKRTSSLRQIPNSQVLSECAVDPELALEVEKRSYPYSPGSDGVLFRQGDSPTCLYCVRKGEVELTMLAGERIVMRVHAGAGSLIGLPAIIGKKPYSMTATSSGNIDIRQLGADDFTKMIQDEPRLSMNVLQILADEIHSAREAFATLMAESPSAEVKLHSFN